MQVSEILIKSGSRGVYKQHICFVCSNKMGDCDYIIVEFTLGDNSLLGYAHLSCVPVSCDMDMFEQIVAL